MGPPIVIQALPTWYNGRRVLVTGHTGFKGSWLTAWLVEAGANVTGFALAPEAGRPALFEEAGLAQRMHSILGDIRDPDALSLAVREARPEVVFHLAAQSLVRRSYREPVATFATNVMGTVHLLEAVRHAPTVGAVVVVTSDKCYENDGTGTPCDETKPMGGSDPYSSSKGCAELATAAYRQSFFGAGAPAIATARAGNVIGGGDWSEDRLIPDLVRAAAAGEAAIIRHPDSVRPWQHVLEPVRGYLMLGEVLAAQGTLFAEGWNFGPNPEDAVTVREVARLLRRSWDRVTIQEGPRGEFPEAALLTLDCKKATQRLAWSPVLTLPESLALTADWYRQWYQDRGSAWTATLTQLRDYRSRVFSTYEAA